MTVGGSFTESLRSFVLGKPPGISTGQLQKGLRATKEVSALGGVWFRAGLMSPWLPACFYQ